MSNKSVPFLFLISISIQKMHKMLNDIFWFVFRSVSICWLAAVVPTLPLWFDTTTKIMDSNKRIKGLTQVLPMTGAEELTANAFFPWAMWVDCIEIVIASRNPSYSETIRRYTLDGSPSQCSSYRQPSSWSSGLQLLTILQHSQVVRQGEIGILSKDEK